MSFIVLQTESEHYKYEYNMKLKVRYGTFKIFGDYLLLQKILSLIEVLTIKCVLLTLEF